MQAEMSGTTENKRLKDFLRKASANITYALQKNLTNKVLHIHSR